MKDEMERAWRNWDGECKETPEAYPSFRKGFYDGFNYARKRGDALAATIRELQGVVTHCYENKEQFIERVRAILGANPDERMKRVEK